MAYNGSGVFNVYTPGTPYVTGTTISSTVANNVNTDFATGLTTAVTKDGQTTTTAVVPFAQGIKTNNIQEFTAAAGVTLPNTIYLGGAAAAEGLRVVPTASAVNRVNVVGAVTGSYPVISAAGSDADIGLILESKGVQGIYLATNGFVPQCLITHTASANRYITLTGSNGGNPTISTSAGSLAIAPAIVTGSSLTVTSAAAGALTVGANGATNPVLQADASTASVATGIKVTGAAAAGGVEIAAISSGTNENLKIDAKGTGTITIGGVSSGAVSIPNLTVAGASGASLVLLSAQTASASASISFTSGISATYDEYIIEIPSLLSSVDTAALQFQISNDGGSTWVSTASYSYATQGYRYSTATAYTDSAAGATQLQIHDAVLGLGTTAKSRFHIRFSGTIGIFDWTGVGKCAWTASGGGSYATGSALNALKFFPASGNFTGVFYLYGVKKS